MNDLRECVAKVKRRSPKHPAPLRQSCYLRRNLHRIARWALFVIAAMFGAAFAMTLVICGNSAAEVLA